MKSIKVKICGLKDEANVRVAVENGADFLGFVFYDKSPRNIAIDEAALLASIARTLNPNIQICAVTVAPDDELLNSLKTFAPDYIQIHGVDNIARIKEIQNQGFKIIHAFGIENAQDLQKAHQFFDKAEFILFDAKPPKNATNAGGFGISFDWDLLKDLPTNLNWFLSGGLNPANISGAIAATKAKNVDVSSGIEGALGIKNPELIKSFLKNAKETKIDASEWLG